jgi:hypothetical protein
MVSALRGFTIVKVLVVTTVVTIAALAIREARPPMRCFCQSETDLNKIMVKKYADEAYPQWSMLHRAKTCPDSIDELAAEEDQREAVDEWGNPLTMLCGDQRPPGVHGVGIVSAGEDGELGTADDVKSWDLDAN